MSEHASLISDLKAGRNCPLEAAAAIEALTARVAELEGAERRFVLDRQTQEMAAAWEREARKLASERDTALARLAKAREAIEQALDDMGAEGHRVCEATKADLRLALGPDGGADLDYSYKTALCVRVMCDETHGKVSPLRTTLAELEKADDKG